MAKPSKNSDEARMVRYIAAMKEALRVVQRTRSASDWRSTLYRLSELHAPEEPEMAGLMRRAADAAAGLVLSEGEFRQQRDRMEVKIARNLEESISLLNILRRTTRQGEGKAGPDQGGGKPRQSLLSRLARRKR